MQKSTAKLALVATSALAGLSTPAVAQDSSGNDIVVTARRVEERLQDVPISITVFNQEQLSERNVTNAQDLANYTPSLSATTSFGAENSTFALRGFVQETGTGPSVGVYFADVVAPRGASQGFPAGDGAGPGSFFDLQNVQVLKGPQGTLFGRNTTGGAVLLVPQKPTGDFEGFVEGSLGSYDMRRLQAVINVPIAESVRLRLGGEHQKRNGYMKNTTGIGAADFDDINYISLRGSLVVDVTPELENYTIGRYTDSDNNGHVQRLFACNPTQSQANFLGLLACAQLQRQGPGFFDLSNDMPDPYSKMKMWQVINTTTWQATDNLTVKNIVSYARLKTKIHADLFGTALVIPQGAFGQVPIPGGGTVPFPFANTPVGFAVIRNIPDSASSNQATFTEEFRLEGNSLGGKLNWQTGFYYENSTPRALIGSQSPVFIGCSDPDNLICTDLTGGGGVNFTAARNTFKTTGIYAQATYALADQLKLTAGARYTWDKVRSISRGITYTFPVGVPNSPPNLTRCTLPGRTLPLCEVDQKASFKKPTWVLGLDYNPTGDMLLYGKYSRGYRAGGIKSDVPQVFILFDPEKVDTYEVGAKLGFAGALSGYFNVAAFYNDFSNQQIQLGFNDNPNNPLVVTPTAGPVNIGTSRIWGVEVDSRVTLFKGFSLAAAYAYLNAKVKKVEQAVIDPNDPYVLNGFVRAGDRLAFTPKHKFNVTAEYRLPIDESLGELKVGATYVYVGNQVANYSNRNVVGFPDFGLLPSYNVVNFNIDWDNFGGGPVDASFFITNAFQEKYFNSVPGLLGSTGFEAGTVGEARMWGVRLKYSFGE